MLYMHDLLKQKLLDYVNDPHSDDANYQLALVYDHLGQSASAYIFYLRASERTDDMDLAYECLLKRYQCLNRQGNREISALALIHTAISLLPKRPEAYFLISRHYERQTVYHQAYMYARLGLEFADFDSKPLRGWVEYPGKYGLLYSQVVSAWPLGKYDEAREVIQYSVDKHRHEFNDEYRYFFQENLSSIGFGGALRKVYDPNTMKDKIRFRFKDFDKITQNHSQVFQDLFVLSVYDGKRGGTYLEVGSGPPEEKSNTLLLERDFEWKGFGVELNSTLVQAHDQYRKNKVFCADATKFEHYDELLNVLAVDGVIDYLQVDCEPPQITYETLYRIPFDRYKFGIVTFEHDYYADVSRSYRDKSRKFFKGRGYKLLVKDIVVEGKNTFEDWWYHPDVIPQNVVDMFIDVNNDYVDPMDYMFTQKTLINKKEHWRNTKWPTMEFTTSIPEKGCVVNCAFCPQRTLEQTYNQDRILTLDNFKKAIDKLPKEIRVTFAGFTEPWLNKHCTDMVLYAYEKGHPISVFTTGVGMKPEDVHRIKHIPFDGGPNGGFCLHLPDAENIAKHPINANYIKVVEAMKECAPQIKNFYAMCMSDKVHPSVSHLFPTAHVPEFWSRAGNLTKEFVIKPELLNIANRIKSVYHGESPKTCNQPEDLYHNVMLPNGDVSLCCQDYNLKHIIGNLFTQEYNDILPETNSCFDLCRYCENGCDPK